MQMNGYLCSMPARDMENHLVWNGFSVMNLPIMSMRCLLFSEDANFLIVCELSGCVDTYSVFELMFIYIMFLHVHFLALFCSWALLFCINSTFSVWRTAVCYTAYSVLFVCWLCAVLCCMLTKCECVCVGMYVRVYMSACIWRMDGENVSCDWM